MYTGGRGSGFGGIHGSQARQRFVRSKTQSRRAFGSSLCLTFANGYATKAHLHVLDKERIVALTPAPASFPPRGQPGHIHWSVRPSVRVSVSQSTHGVN